ICWITFSGTPRAYKLLPSPRRALPATPPRVQIIQLEIVGSVGVSRTHPMQFEAFCNLLDHRDRAFAAAGLWIVYVTFPDCPRDTNLTFVVVFPAQAL